MMFKVEIRSSSYIENGNGIKTWWDHTGKTENKIDKFVFSKEYHEEYIPGHYPIESFGSLYRNIDNFCESPIQAITDWEITIPSIYSSKDGSFSTVDLIYHLEAINEEILEENYSEFLIGCEAVLYEDGNIIYRGVVNSISSSGGSTSISIGERLGAPEIPKSNSPLPLGNAGTLYWPVEVTTNELRQDVIKISEKELGSFNGFYIYMEEIEKYLKVKFDKVFFSAGYTEAVFFELFSNDEFIAEVGADAKAEDELRISKNLMETLPHIDSPYSYVVKKDKESHEEECVQAWHNCKYPIDENYYSLFASQYDSKTYEHKHPEELLLYDHVPQSYLLGRAPLKDRINIYSDYKIFKREECVITHSSEINAEYTEFLYPISLTYKGENSDHYIFMQIGGDPSFFLETSRTQGTFDLEKYPYIIEYGNTTGTFSIKFPKLDLPNHAIIESCRLCYKIIHESISWSYIPNTLEWKGIYFSHFGISFRQIYADWDGQHDNLDWRYVEQSLETVPENLEISLEHREKASCKGRMKLIGAYFEVKIKINMPLKDAKLYASGTIADWNYDNAQQNNYVIPSINGLLKSVNMLASTPDDSSYSVQKIGELSEIKYGHILHNEAAKFRDKLRSLAAESATLVKFSPTENKLLVKSVSRQLDEEIIPITIGMDAIVLENNLFDFKMESPHRDDVIKGVSLYWGKDTESGKYKHSFVLDSLEFCIDGECYDMTLDGVIGDKWNPIKYRLGINSNLNIGTTKSINCEWITDLAGAELFAYNYLCWNCAPLRKAQANCIFPVLKEKYKVDIGDFVNFELPGYPPKFAKTAWVITGIQDDLDSMVTTLELLETWNMPVVPKNRFLLLENLGNIFIETEEKIKLEGLNG